MKFTKTHENQLRGYFELMDANGCVPVTEWVSGSGRYAKPKALPPFVKRYEKREYAPCERPAKGTPERTAFEFFNANPKKKFVLVLDKEALAGFMFGAAHGTEF